MNVVGRVLNDLGIAYMDIVPTSGKSNDDAADMSPRDFATILDTAQPWEPMPSENWHRIAAEFLEDHRVLVYNAKIYLCTDDRWTYCTNATFESLDREACNVTPPSRRAGGCNPRPEMVGTTIPRA